MRKENSILTEDTRFNLKFGNVWAILVSAVLFAFGIGVYYAGNKTQEVKLDTIIVQQKELTLEFRDWKKQAETRLGTVEKEHVGFGRDIANLISLVGQHLKIDIK